MNIRAEETVGKFPNIVLGKSENMIFPKAITSKREASRLIFVTNSTKKKQVYSLAGFDVLYHRAFKVSMSEKKKFETVILRKWKN